MNRVRCDVLVQTDAVSCSERCTQVNIGQSTQWTQCAIHQTDQSAQAVCTQTPATVQVTPQTSSAAVQTVPAATEPADSLPGLVVEVGVNIGSGTTGRCQVEEGAGDVMSKNQGEVTDSVSGARQVMDDVVEDSPSHSASSGEQQQQQQEEKDCSGSSSVHATTAIEFNSRDSLPDTMIAVRTPVTTGTITAAIEQQLRPSLCDGGGISQLPAAAVQKQFPATTVRDISQPAMLRPSFAIDTTQWRSHTAAKCVYSFEKRTFLARSLTVKQCSEVSSVSVEQLADEVLSVTRSVAQISDCLALNANPLLEVCGTGRVEGSDEANTITDRSLAPMPLVLPAFHPHVSDGGGSDGLSAKCQRHTVCTSHVDSSSTQSQSTKDQAVIMTQKQPTWSALLPSTSLPADVIHSTSLPASELTSSASVSTSSHQATRLEQSALSESVEHCPHPPTTESTRDVSSQISAMQDDGFCAGDNDSGKLSEYSEFTGCENMTAGACDQSKAYESQPSALVSSCFSSRHASSAYGGSKADSGRQCDSKEKKASMSRLSECSVTRGRRRPLFVHRGPLMETVATLEGSDIMSARHKLHKDSESRKLPVMLLGMFRLSSSSFSQYTVVYSKVNHSGF